MNINIPSWLLQSEEYVPAPQKDTFIEKTIIGIIRVMSRAAYYGDNSESGKIPVTLRLFVLIGLLIFISLIRSISILYIVLALILTFLATKDAKTIIKVLKGALAATLFSLIIVLPAVIINKSLYYFMLSLKVFLSATCVLYFCHSTRWNDFTKSLRKCHIPKTFIFVLDMTLKYINILGTVALGMLEALSLRNVGAYKKKYLSIFAVLGMTFIKSRELSEEMFEAMECRGFTGDYE